MPVGIAVLVLHIHHLADDRHEIAQAHLLTDHLLLLFLHVLQIPDNADLLRLLIRLADGDKLLRVRQREGQVNADAVIFLVLCLQGKETALRARENRIFGGEEAHMQNLFRLLFQRLLVKFLQIQKICRLHFFSVFFHNNIHAFP